MSAVLTRIGRWPSTADRGRSPTRRPRALPTVVAILPRRTGMTRTAHRIGLAAVVVALTAAAYAQSGTGAVTSSISLSFSGGTRISVGDQASLFGFVSLSDGSPANGLTVHVTRTNPDHTETVVGDVTTTSDQGGFNFVDSPPARGTYTYTATFAGDA